MMRKKIAMRKGGKVAKYAEGGTVFNYEDMLADAGVPGFSRRAAPAPQASPRARPSLITGNPVGSNRARGLEPVGSDIMSGGRTMAPAPMPGDDVDGTGTGAAARPVRRGPARQASPRARQAVTATRSRSREMSADELNEREMTRILNERSLEAARSGRSMYKRGGKVTAKKRK